MSQLVGAVSQVNHLLKIDHQNQDDDDDDDDDNKNNNATNLKQKPQC